MLSLLRNTTFLIITCATFAVSTAGLAVKTFSLSAQVAGLTASAATAAVTHRKELAATVSRVKAKARLRRLVAAIPLRQASLPLRSLSDAIFFRGKKKTPDGTFGQYGCEASVLSAEVMDEVLQELPEAVRPRKETVLKMLPKCDE